MPLLIKLPDITGISPTVRYLNVLDRKKTAVQRQLRREGLRGYEPDFLATIFALADSMPKNFIFFDVGAHIGLYSALMEKIFSAKCFAFEPDPETFKEGQRLKKNNNLHYKLTQAAVSTQDSGHVELFLSPKAETSNSLNPDFRPGSKGIFIPVTSLNAFTRDQGTEPHLVKIDVETFEPEVLLGSLEMLERAKPFITCELLPQTNLSRLAEALNALKNMGYKFVHIMPATPWKECSIQEVLSELQSDARDWMFVPSMLPAEFHTRRVAWLKALDKCGKETNLEVEGKASKPLPLEIPAKISFLGRITKAFSYFSVPRNS